MYYALGFGGGKPPSELSLPQRRRQNHSAWLGHVANGARSRLLFPPSLASLWKDQSGGLIPLAAVKLSGAFFFGKDSVVINICKIRVCKKGLEMTEYQISNFSLNKFPFTKFEGKELKGSVNGMQGIQDGMRTNRLNFTSASLMKSMNMLWVSEQLQNSTCQYLYRCPVINMFDHS